MKKTLLIAISFVAVLSVKAQIPNAGFENWTTVGSYEDPDGWSTLNSSTAPLSVLTCTKGTPGHPGNSYIKLTAKSLGAFGTVPGLAVTGNLNTITQTVSGGFAYSQRPLLLEGSFQHMATGTGGAIVVAFTKWNSTTMSEDTIGGGALSLTGMAMSWSNFSIPITYFSSMDPDTCMILMVTSNPAVANDYLWVDDLHFTFTSGIENTNTLSLDASLFPNPAHNLLNVEADFPEASHYTLEITDITGRILIQRSLMSPAGQYNFNFNVAELQAGLYLFNIKQGDATQTKTFVIN